MLRHYAGLALWRLTRSQSMRVPNCLEPARNQPPSTAIRRAPLRRRDTQESSAGRGRARGRAPRAGGGHGHRAVVRSTPSSRARAVPRSPPASTPSRCGDCGGLLHAPARWSLGHVLLVPEPRRPVPQVWPGGRASRSRPLGLLLPDDEAVAMRHHRLRQLRPVPRPTHVRLPSTRGSVPLISAWRTRSRMPSGVWLPP
jgi:hypothetical protein